MSGTLPILYVVLDLPSEAYKPNVDVIQAELFLACTITILYALGALISAYVMLGTQTPCVNRSANSVIRLGNPCATGTVRLGLEWSPDDRIDFRRIYRM